jgi:uncharacterized iron-regulated protein
MAEHIAAHWQRERIKTIVFAGNGHIANKFGVPDRTLSRVPATGATLVLHPLSGPATLDRKEADYVWLTGDCSRSLRPVSFGR